MTDASPVLEGPSRDLFNENRDVLAEVAKGVLEEGYDAEDFVVLCIDSRPMEWIPAITYLVTSFDVNPHASRPIVVGALSVDDVWNYFEGTIPEIIALLKDDDRSGRDGLIRVLCIRGDSAGIFYEELEVKDPSAN